MVDPKSIGYDWLSAHNNNTQGIEIGVIVKDCTFLHTLCPFYKFLTLKPMRLNEFKLFIIGIFHFTDIIRFTFFSDYRGGYFVCKKSALCEYRLHF